MSDRNIIKLAPIPKMPSINNKVIRKLRVAVYARVSTDHEEQQSSFDAQVDYYTNLITKNSQWEFVKVYADEGISGCRVDKRNGFQEMIADCDKGLIDLILTKSVSRFARNTVDSITTIRHLREKNIGVMFEKENIMTLDAKGEFLLTLMSSLAQEESRSISENVRWGQRKRFADGKSSLAYSRFLGYDKGTEKYKMVINEGQALIVRTIFRMCLQGYSPHTIALKLTDTGIPSPGGCEKWNQSTIRRMLSNEKYKGDALLQKEFTVDFLTKKTKKNCGELPQYYVEGDHEAIIAPWLFDHVQEYMAFKREFYDAPCRGRCSGIRLYSGKIICGKCGNQFGVRPWHSTTYNYPVWQCRSRYDNTVNCKTINIYDAYLHIITHSMAVERIKKMPRVVEDLLSCIEAVVGTERTEMIGDAVRKILKEITWKLWSDEDDLALVIERLIVHENGKVTLLWIDGKETQMQIENFKPSIYFIENLQSETSTKKQENKPKSKRKKNDEQKKQVIALRNKGVSYGQISEKLDMNLNTVKSICQRNCNNKQEEQTSGYTHCLYCGKLIMQIANRKKKKFCSNNCRYLWWQKNGIKESENGVHSFVCKHCGTEFQTYGCNQRKYCCHECYVADRYEKKDNE